MATNRKGFENYVIKMIELMLQGKSNTELYRVLFDSMNDEEFADWIVRLKERKIHLVITVPNFAESKLTVINNWKIIESMGETFNKRIWMPAKGDSPSYLTPLAYLVLRLPLRRQAQFLQKKISIPQDNNSVDNFTGQPTGKSKGSKISYPEIQVLASLGLDQSLTEFLKPRGGDEAGFNAMNAMISRTGGVSLAAIEPYSGTVKSTLTLSTILKAMMLQNTLIP